ncbi:MAG: type IX secretion system membrane protein PorP/SprF [Salibacteraceae bacterium]
MNRRNFISFFFLIGMAGGAVCQEPQFSQYYSAPLYLNPGFAGNTIQGRAVMNYRNQWPAMPGQFVTYAASLDYNLEAYNSGVALSLEHDKAGSAALRYTNIGFHYSYTIRVSRNTAIKPGVYFSYTSRDVNQADLVFGDQIVFDNPVSSSLNRFSVEPVRYADLGTGGIIYQRNWWAGIAAHHINRPNQSLFEDQVRLPVLYTLHGGYNYVISQNARKKEISSITGVMHYKAQGKWDQLDIGAYYRFKLVTFGLYYRGLPLLKRNGYAHPNQDAIIGLLGLEYNDFSFGYSYDLNISRLISDSGGAHEISLIFEFASERKKRKRTRSRFLIPCAKF